VYLCLTFVRWQISKYYDLWEAVFRHFRDVPPVRLCHKEVGLVASVLSNLKVLHIGVVAIPKNSEDPQAGSAGGIFPGNECDSKNECETNNLP